MSSVGVVLRPRAPVSAGAALGLVGLAIVLGVGVAKAPTIVIPLVLLGAFGAVTLIAPDVATLVVVGLMWMNVPGVLIQSHGVPNVIGAAVPLLLAVPLIAHARRGGRVVATPVFVLLILLLVAELASTLHSANQVAALDKIRTLLFEAGLLYFFASNVIRTPTMLRRTLWVVLAAGAALAFVTVFQEVTRSYTRFYSGFALPDPSFLIGKSDVPRASGPVGDPNYYGQILIVSACVALVYGWRARTPALRVVALGALAMITYAIFLSFSRGTMMALFFVIVVMAFMRYFKAWQLTFMVFALVGVLIAVPAFSERIASVTSVSSATQQTGTDANADQSTQGRATEMAAAAQVFVDHPVLGVGPGNFPLYYREYAERIGGEIHDAVSSGKNKGAQAERQAHNMYISQLAELGLLGSLPFFAILIGVSVALGRTRKLWVRRGERENADLATILLLSVISYLFCALFLTLAFERFFWLLLGIAGAATSLALRDPDRVPDRT